MTQRDFILKEIEKIGAMINAIRQKIFGGKDNASITLETQIENAKEMLSNGINFDLDNFLDLDLEKSNNYICSFEGFSVENIELLAQCISQIGFSDKCEHPQKYLEKALQLYKLCNSESKTYSFERERSIEIIENALQENNDND